jgi:hypothetical protein
VIGLGLLGGHHLTRVVAVAARADAAADHHRRLIALEDSAQVLQQGDGLLVDLRHVGLGVAELGAPVGGGAPGRALQDEAAPVLAGDRGVGAEVAPERRLARLVLHQVEGGEVGQVDPVVENQGGLDPTVGQKKSAGKLRQVVSILGH